MAQFKNPLTNPQGFLSSQPGGFFAPPKNKGFEGILSDPRLSIGMAIAQGQPIGQALLGGAIQAKEIEAAMFPEADDVKPFSVFDETLQKNVLITSGMYAANPDNYTPAQSITETDNIKIVNDQIIDYTDPEKPKIIFDARDDPSIKTQIVDGQVVITNTETGISSATPIKGFVKNTSEDLTKRIEFYNKQYTNNSITKNFNTATTQVSKLFSSAKDPSAAGDLSMIFTFMKILDPRSVVREGEQATAQNAAGTPDRIRNLYNKLFTGERLTLKQREDFVKKGIALYQSNQLSLDRFKSSYQDSFIGLGINPSSIFTDSDFRPKKIKDPETGETINVPKGTLLINYDPTKDSYIYQMPDGTKFQVGRQKYIMTQPVIAKIYTDTNTDTISPTNLREVPYKIRFAVQAMPNLESKIATLQKFYPVVEQDPNDPSNFFVTDSKGQQFILDNKSETNMGDYIDLARPIAQAIGGTVGTGIGFTSGLGTGPGAVVASPAGAVAGAGLGTAAGSEVVELAAQLFGAEIVRTPQELVSERITDFSFGAGGQLVVPPIVNFVGKTLYKSPAAAKAAYKRLTDFADAGVAPSLGQATLNRGIQTVELILGNFPGSSSVITRMAQTAQDDLAKESTRIATNLINTIRPASTIRAGRSIKLGISNNHGIYSQDSFVGRFHSKANQLYGEVDKYIPTDSSVNLNNTILQLEAQVADIPGAEATSKVFKNQFLNDVLENLNKDLAENGALPYAAVKQLRSVIGRKLSEVNLVPDVDKAQLKLIYKALSDDLLTFAQTQGKDAVNSLNRANKYYNAGLSRITNFLEPINRVADPDRIVSLLLASGKEGSSRINALKKSLTDDQYRVVLSSIIDRLGRARASTALAEEAAGEVTETFGRFSSETFLTNWNSLAPSAKDVLFSGKNLVPLRTNLDKIARISSIIREGGKTFQNPSGTANSIVGQGLFLGGLGTAFTGDPAFILSVPLIIASARVSTKLIQNPAFVKWMAEGTDIATEQGVKGVLEHTGKLGNIMANSDSETRQHIQNYLQMLIDYSNNKENIENETIDKNNETIDKNEDIPLVTVVK